MARCRLSPSASRFAEWTGGIILAVGKSLKAIDDIIREGVGLVVDLVADIGAVALREGMCGRLPGNACQESN
jgi:hypothetical protein